MRVQNNLCARDVFWYSFLYGNGEHAVNNFEVKYRFEANAAGCELQEENLGESYNR